MKGEYEKRMRTQLEDFEKYAACLSEPPVRGIRVNTLKTDPAAFRAAAPFATSPVPWNENGFYTKEEDRPGKSPYHDAGLYYVQEPSAQAAAPMLCARPGERVLDLCAAPGGKGTDLAQAMRGQGILVLNEKIPDRAAVLSQNVERLGVRNAVVTCAGPDTLGDRFPGYFDKILVDAPCSGEGMFRRDPEAERAWSQETVDMCAARQRKILASAHAMLRGGGSLLYSTCTFSPEECEENRNWLLASYPDLTLKEEKKLYPHRVRGEGHYCALFVREDETEDFFAGREKPCQDRRTLALYRNFEACAFRAREEGEIYAFGNTIYLYPGPLFSLRGLRVLRAGVRLGSCENGRFVPAHALAAAKRSDEFQRTVSMDDAAAEVYHRGGTLPCGEEDGWCAAVYGGHPLGFGKCVGGVMKNHYPKALRR